MNLELPLYLLLTEVFPAGAGEDGGRWQFVLQQRGGPARIEAADDEPGIGGERLQLLSVVRGLEALDQPSQVTLVTTSRHVGRGIRNGLAAWKESNWRWERFGEMCPVKNCDLWQRIDRAMNIHRVDCRIWRVDATCQNVRQPVAESREIRLHATAPSLLRKKVRELSGALAGKMSSLARAGFAANL